MPGLPAALHYDQPQPDDTFERIPMTIATGSRLGPYEIVSPLGAGGMGEVYKAKDTRLDREVAVKVLPTHLSENTDLRQRFEREAKAISQLSHPHICALYDVGSQDGVEYLVMELLEGQTLADRLERGALPLDQVLKNGVEIADALEKAHKRGIVHRDLKPGNVMLTKSGVKLLDFGLAKSLAPARQEGFTSLPTEAQPPLTEKGTVMGTFQYMSPEQLEGKEADHRADLFALGCVLYEMATGKKAFAGKSRASTIAAILASDPPPISSLAPMTPPALDRVVKSCLAKDPDDRWQSAHDVKSELQWIAEAGSQAGAPATVVSRRKSRERMAWVGLGLALAAAAGFAALWLRGRRAPEATLRSSLDAAEGSTVLLYNDPSGPPAISPDGKSIAYVASLDGKFQIWVRALDSLDAHPVPGVEQASYPFWSPDSKWLAYFAGGKLQKIALAGGAPQTIADAPNGRGGTWSSEGVILFAPDVFGALSRVPAAGGSVAPATALDKKKHQATHRFPVFLPDGRHFVYLGGSSGLHGRRGTDGIFAGMLGESTATFLTPSSSQAEYADGFLLCMQGSALQAFPFDPSSRRIRGDPVTLANPVQRDWGRYAGAFSAAGNGLLLYIAGDSGGSTRLAWFDRSGKKIETFGTPALYSEPSISPDGRKVAIGIQNPLDLTFQIFLFGAAGAPPAAFTFGPSSNGFPVWSGDGSEILFSSNRTHDGDLYRKAISGRETEKLVAEAAEGYPTDWSRDGRYVAYGRFPGGTGSAHTDLWIAPTAPGSAPYRLSYEGIKDPVARFSPDGRWLAYNSYESGISRIYVASFPEAGGKWQISPSGGYEPRWKSDGRALYFIDEANQVMEAEISTSPTFEVGSIKPLFRLAATAQTDEWQYDVAPDASRFLFVVPTDSGRRSSSITLVTNWGSALSR
jgi:Tol biopolymer transport system component